MEDEGRNVVAHDAKVGQSDVMELPKKEFRIAACTVYLPARLVESPAPCSFLWNVGRTLHRRPRINPTFGG
jgi:hypothetical protein